MSKMKLEEQAEKKQIILQKILLKQLYGLNNKISEAKKALDLGPLPKNSSQKPSKSGIKEIEIKLDVLRNIIESK